jgi:CelD/BcsL family acetyltransferase involved in cellulose biosynthesis
MAKTRQKETPSISKSMSKFQAKIVENLDDLLSLRELWNTLLMNSAADHFFLTWEWAYSWAHCFTNPKRKLFVITVHEADVLVGIAPWYLSQDRVGPFLFRQIHFLGEPEGSSDYLDVILRRGKEKEVTLFIYEFINQTASTKWDALSLKYVPADSLFVTHLLSKVAAEGKYVEVSQGAYCPIVNLPGSFEQYFCRLSKNRREQHRRHTKMLYNSGEIAFETQCGKSCVAYFDIFFKIYQKNWNHNAKTISRMLETYISISDHGEALQIDFLKCNGTYVAGLLHFHHQDALLMYLMAVDKDCFPKISIGNILVGLSLENAIRDGKSTYDFLKGLEEYKFHWATGGVTTLNIQLMNIGLVSSTTALIQMMKNYAKILLR